MGLLLGRRGDKEVVAEGGEVGPREAYSELNPEAAEGQGVAAERGAGVVDD